MRYKRFLSEKAEKILNLWMTASRYGHMKWLLVHRLLIPQANEILESYYPENVQDRVFHEKKSP